MAQQVSSPSTELAVADPRAVALIRTVCERAGSLSFLDDIYAEIRRLHLDVAIATSNTAPIFDWLMATFSFLGISDRVAHDYIERHGPAAWSDVGASLTLPPSCQKLRSYWQYADCGYKKGNINCSEPSLIDTCPVPRLKLRNGRLNQAAYSLYLFIRDIADGDIVRWIAGQSNVATATRPDDLQAARQEAIIGPLRNIFGVSDKVLTMALSSLTIGVRGQRRDWFETGKAMVTIYTLVHNFMHRTGILQALRKTS